MSIISVQDLDFLKGITRDVIAASIAENGQSVVPGIVNNLGADVLRPGGRNCYPALWTRDYAMSLECGLVPSDLAVNCFRCIAKHQAERRIEFASGGIVEPGTIPDHVNFNDEPIYYPGTYSYSDQGGKWGIYAPYDDNFFFIDAAWRLCAKSWKELFPRLEQAYNAVPSSEDNGIVQCDESNWGVSFGFTDSIVHTGKLLFASLLKCRAARSMACIAAEIGNRQAAAEYELEYNTLKNEIPGVFMTETGLLRASTGKSCQSDVWGSAFAVYEDLVPEEIGKKLGMSLAALLAEGQIARHGMIRHIPVSEGYWDTTETRHGYYQNGAYWGTATGWAAFAVQPYAPEIARQLVEEYIAELRENDFRKGEIYCSPYEFISEEGIGSNPVYMTSVTCPFAAFLRCIDRSARNE